MRPAGRSVSFLGEIRVKASIAKLCRPLSVLGLSAALSSAPLLAAEVQEAPGPEARPAAVAAPHGGAIFAVINGREVTSQEYEEAFVSLVRQRFYHGQVPEDELLKARDEVKERLVQRVVLLEEAKRRGIEPDQAWVEQSVADYERRYVTDPRWLESRDKVLPGVRAQLSEKNVVAQLENQVRNLPEPSEADVLAFYTAKPELFTEPEKLRLSAIMLRVDPSSPATTWDATREEANAILARLEAGGDFNEAARLHSSDFAGTSGDMGYLHRGMLPDTIQAKVDDFVVGKINPPIDVLEGVVILRLEERVAPKKREFAEVATRARELLVRESQEEAWRSLTSRLVGQASVKFMQAPTTDLGKRTDN